MSDTNDSAPLPPVRTGPRLPKQRHRRNQEAIVEQNRQDYLARKVEQFRKALMEAHSHDWTMEVVAEAAHICARAQASVFRTEATDADS